MERSRAGRTFSVPNHLEEHGVRWMCAWDDSPAPIDTRESKFTSQDAEWRVRGLLPGNQEG